MKKTLIATALLTALAAASGAQAATYDITAVWHEPDTQPRDSIFIGSFDYDAATHAVSNLKGVLSESMTGDPFNAGPNGDYGMTWLDLNNQLVSWYDAALGGTFAATFKNTNTDTFIGGTWTPEDGVDAGGIYSGWAPKAANRTPNPGNAYALIFVPDDPLAALTQAQLDKIAYADCAPGGMMGAVCMTGTSIAGYGAIGTMSGYPVAQAITAAVPEPEAYAMLLAGLGLTGLVVRRRRQLA
jgi:hypothetical protein